MRSARPHTTRVQREALKVAAYQRYMKSDAWAAVRARYWEKYGRSCKARQGKEDLHVHHRTYDRLGHEDLSDLWACTIDALARSLQRIPRAEALARGMRVDPYIGLPNDFKDGI